MSRYIRKNTIFLINCKLTSIEHKMIWETNLKTKQYSDDFQRKRTSINEIAIKQLIDNINQLHSCSLTKGGRLFQKYGEGRNTGHEHLHI